MDINSQEYKEALKRADADLKKPPEEIRKKLIECGVLTEDGKLRKAKIPSVNNER